MTPEQCRAARALLRWSQEALAVASGVSTKTVRDFERGTRNPTKASRQVIYAALTAAGIEFTPDGATRRATPPPQQH